MSDVPILRWEGCYDGSLKGLIHDSAFQHPAKFSRNLIEKIYDHCLERGYFKKGDLIGDPFGGVGCGGIIAAYRGLNWIGCELEPKFVTLAELNFAMHKDRWNVLGVPYPTIFRGDSRKFDEHVAAVSSPPYADSVHDGNGIDQSKLTGNTAGKNTQALAEGYGESDGQIGSLKSGAVEAVIASPPFTQGYQSGGGINKNGYGKDGADKVGSRTYQGQGGDRTDGNIETLKEGTVQAVVSSPPYISGGHHADQTGAWNTNGRGQGQTKDQANYGKEEGQIGQLKGGEVSAVISSPPYSDIAAGAGGLNTKPAKHPGQQSGRKAESASQDTDQKYGKAEGQISQLKGGTVDACISSPPYSDIRPEKSGSGVNIEKQWETYRSQGGGMGLEAFRAQQEKHSHGYGKSDGQISQLKGGSVDACVSSLPWENNCEGGVKKGKFNYVLADTKGHGSTPAAKQRAMERDEQKTYGDSDGQIGKETAETYWTACKLVYEACYRSIRSGGVIVLVVKNYVKNKKIVPLCEDTMRLLEHIGFVPLERIHAMLKSETVHNDLFETETKTVKSRKSFFRRLAESKGSPAIDWEEVLICRRP